MPFSDGSIGFFSRKATLARARSNLYCRYSWLPFRTPSGLWSNDGAFFGINFSGTAKLKLRFEMLSALNPPGVIPTFRNDPVLSTRDDQFGHIEQTIARKSPWVIVLACQSRPYLWTTTTNPIYGLSRGGVQGFLLVFHIRHLPLIVRGVKLFPNLVYGL